MREAIFHIANDATKFRLGMTNNFRLNIPGLSGIADKTSGDNGAVLPEDTETTLRIAAETFKEPTLSQSSITLKRGNLSIELPGQMEAFSSSSSFACFIDSDTYGKLYAWKCQAGDHETGEVGDPADYWKTVTVEHVTGKGELIGTWTLYNCWLSSLEGVTFDHNSADYKKVNVTLKYFRPEWRKA